MNPCRHWFRLPLTSALLACLVACGGSGDGASDVAASATGDRFAVSSSPAPGLASKAGKPEPIGRPGAEAPLDSAPNQVSKMPGIRLFATGFEAGVAFTHDFLDSRYRHLTGGDSAGYQFPITLGDAIAGWPSRINAEVGDAAALAADHYASASLPTVAGRNGLPTRAMALHNMAKSRAIEAQQISLENAELASAPVAYQRMWIKFDAGTLARARAIGPDRFYQTFWEVKGVDGDFWLRLKLHLDPAGKLFWVAKGNGVAASGSDARPWWITRLEAAPVTIADESDAAGWHKIEIWLDAPGGRFKVSIDGHPLLDRGDVRPAKGERIDTWRMAMVGSTVAPLARVLFDDLEFWTLPPADAFQQ